jgi:hypothetical protein
MATFWCANFDTEPPVLDNGLEQGFWAMQYQYSHDGHIYQGHRDVIASTSKNWNAVRDIKAGDWLAAYLQSSRFYAIGEVCEPRPRDRHAGQPHHQGSIARVVREHEHRYRSGVIRYADASAFYEDFTDNWSRSFVNHYSQAPENWRYAQRVDVRDWLYVVRGGVEVEGLADAVAFPRYRMAIFEIPETFFERIRARLQQGSRNSRRTNRCSRPGGHYGFP